LLMENNLIKNSNLPRLIIQDHQQNDMVPNAIPQPVLSHVIWSIFTISLPLKIYLIVLKPLPITFMDNVLQPTLLNGLFGLPDTTKPLSVPLMNVKLAITPVTQMPNASTDQKDMIASVVTTTVVTDTILVLPLTGALDPVSVTPMPTASLVRAVSDTLASVNQAMPVQNVIQKIHA
jgi:hypothetical protein